MNKTWKRQTAEVAETLQVAARSGSRWARGFSVEAAASGIPETPTPEAVQCVLRAAVVLLEHRLSDAAAARENRRRWLARLRPLRADRLAAQRDVYELLVRIRRMAVTLFGTSAAGRLFPRGETPQKADELLQWSRRVIRALRTVRADEAPEPSVFVDVGMMARLAESLTERVTRLEEAQREVVTGESAAARALTVRDHALARLGRTQKGVKRLFEALSALADLPVAG